MGPASSESLVKLLLDYDKGLQISDNALLAAVTQPFCDTGGLRLLLERSDHLCISVSILKATKEPRVMKLLFQHSDIWEITSDVLQAAASKGSNRRRFFELLFSYEPKAPVIESLVFKTLKYVPYSPGIVHCF